jgi:carbamoyl-phosphate synthase large subunit
MRKVMILGAGRGQIPIMNLCHDYGWYVIAVSPNGNYPGLKVADQVYYLDVKDKEAVLEAAKNEKIQAILTDQLDAGVLTAAYVAEKMGLPGITYDVALKFTNKYIMRQEAAKLGINVPFSISVSKLEDAVSAVSSDSRLAFPLMMKPVDDAGSRGVYQVNSIDDIVEKFDNSRQYSKSGGVILEQFIEGDEYVVHAFTRDYVVTNLIVGRRDYFQIPGTFIPNSTMFVDADSAKSDLEVRLKEINRKLVEGFGLIFGNTEAEYLYNAQEDKIYLGEIAARGGGVFTSSHLVPGASGVNANDLLVREALRIEGKRKIKIHTGASAYFCYMLPQGIVRELDGIEQVKKIDGVMQAYFDNIEIGMESESITDKYSRKGPILVCGKTKKDCCDIMERVKGVLNIKVDTGEKLSDVIWHDMI